MKLEFPLLTKEQIEVKIKKVGKNGANSLLYKTARTDMDILDSVVGADKWRNDYAEIKGNLYCTIYVRDENGEWVGKQDCGIESRADGDGNEKKGEASDAFKRAGFRWGIGRELYTAPFTFLHVETEQENGRWKLADPFARFTVGKIEYDNARRICALDIVDNHGNVVYSMTGSADKNETGESRQKPPAQKTGTLAHNKSLEAKQAEENAKLLKSRKDDLHALAVSYGIEDSGVNAIVSDLIAENHIKKGKLYERSEVEYHDMYVLIDQTLKNLGYAKKDAS